MGASAPSPSPEGTAGGSTATVNRSRSSYGQWSARKAPRSPGLTGDDGWSRYSASRSVRQAFHAATGSPAARTRTCA